MLNIPKNKNKEKEEKKMEENGRGGEKVMREGKEASQIPTPRVGVHTSTHHDRHLFL